MPPVTAGLLDGQLAWRQHDGGHTDRPELEDVHRLGRQEHRPPGAAEAHGRRDGARAGRSACAAHRRQLDDRARAAAREGEARADRRLLRRRLDHAPLGRDGLSGAARELDAELLRLERGRLRLGRRSDREHDLANRPRRARRRQPEGHRGARRHEQRRRHAGRRRQGRRHHARPARAGAAVPRQGAERHDRAHGDLPAQRQHGSHAGDRRDQQEPRGAWPTARRRGFWT